MSREHRRRQRESGFTLLEMIIAVTLVAMLAVSIWGVFRISIESWKRGTEYIDANQRHRTILDLVKKQMASTYGLIAPVDLRTGGARYPLFAGTESSLQFISLNAARKADAYQISANFLAVRMSEIYGGNHIAVLPKAPKHIQKKYDEYLKKIDLLISSAGTRRGFLFL